MKHLFSLAMVLLFSLQSHAVFGGGDHAGNGGNDVGLEFESSFHRAIDAIKQYKIAGLEKIAAINYDSRLTDLKVVVVNEPLVITVGDGTQECVAINYPLKQIVQLNGARWKAISDPKVREGLALHEILSILGMETSGQYPYSGRYLSAFSLDPVATYQKYPVHTGDLEISTITEDNVSAKNILARVSKSGPGYDVTANLITEFVGGAAGMSRIVLTIYDTSAEKSGFGGDGSNSVSYEIAYVNDPPSAIKLEKQSEFAYRLSFKAEAVIYKDADFKYKTKTVTAEIRLDSKYSITDVKFKE
jgi:hypothetical protein